MLSIDWGNDLAKLTIFRYWGDNLAKLIIFRYWGDEIGLYEKFSISIKNIGGMLPDYRGGYIPSFLPRVAPMLIEFPKSKYYVTRCLAIKSGDKSYPTDQKTSSVCRNNLRQDRE